MRLLPLASALLLVPPATAQLREPGTPATLRADLPADVPVLVVPAGRLPAVRGTDPDEPGPFRYGVELAVGRGLADAGRWDTLASGENVWRLELASPGAFSLGVQFARFDLPPGAQVFLYDPGHQEVLGAYGESTESPDGALAVQPLRGDRVVIEYVEPAGTVAEPELVVESLVHDYVDILARMAQGSALGLACLVDVNCPAGANHQDIKRAVVWIVRSGAGCSASILNNTADDGTPYLMTAEHCGNFTSGVFVFDYERSGCSTGTSSQSKTLSGAVRLAVSSFYDGQLYRLNQAIPASYEPFFAGWSRSTLGTPTVGISHPAGNPKKIQIDRQTPFLLNTRWSVQWDVGAIQGGSSGSPLFDANERIIGSLSTGSSGCSINGNYGRFDLFYSTQGLATWLDPLGWDPTGLDGLDGIEPYTHAYHGSGANPELLVSTNAPRLGTSWSAKVDASSVPSATSVLYVGHRQPDEGVFASYGEVLVDLASPRLFEHIAPIVGGFSTHTFALPANLGLVGRVAYSQAFVLGPIVQATNGLKIVLHF